MNDGLEKKKKVIKDIFIKKVSPIKKNSNKYIDEQNIFEKFLSSYPYNKEDKEKEDKENEENQEDEDEDDDEDDDDENDEEDEHTEEEEEIIDKHMKKKYATKSIEMHYKLLLDNISTEGLSETYNEYSALPSYVRQKLPQCEYCQKFFSQDLIVKWSDTSTCMHCYFWTHYNESVREEADGKIVYIVDYILKCKEAHDYSSCATSMKADFCFICDYTNGNKLKWIKERNRLFGDEVDNSTVPLIGTEDDEYEIEI